MQWNTYLNGACGQRRLYMFNYDAANRLTAATHRTWIGSAWTDLGQYSESGITYDLNGNIKTYNRQGLISAPNSYGNIDLLTYTYGDTQRPDRLTKVVDTGNAGKGFKYNPPATGNHYAYDGNGNIRLAWCSPNDRGLSLLTLNAPPPRFGLMTKRNLRE